MTETKRFELLIFDWDGTIADSTAQIVAAMRHAIEECRLEPRPDAALRELIGLGIHDILQRLYPDSTDLDLQRLLQSYRGYAILQQAHEAPMYAGVPETLQALAQAGYPLAVATGKGRPGLRRAFAARPEISRLFITSRCADETASKPNPLMLKEILAELDVAPHAALMIGDTEFDVQMAGAIGMPAVGVACGVHEPDRLLRAGALAVISSVANLGDWLAPAVGTDTRAA